MVTKKASTKAAKKTTSKKASQKTTPKAKQKKKTARKKAAQPTTPKETVYEPYPDILELVARSRKCEFDYRKGDLVQNIMPHPSRSDLPIYGKVIRVCKESLVVYRSNEKGVLHADLGNAGGPKVDTMMKACAKLIERCQSLGKVERINLRPLLNNRGGWKRATRSPDFVYINIAYRDLEESPLANPFALGTASSATTAAKQEAKEQFEAALDKAEGTDAVLWQSVELLGRRVAQGEDLRLGCFCGAEDICHGDSLIPRIQGIAERLRADAS